MRIAVIPARGGSKRIPRKNIRVFAGKPMIAHSILAAQKSEMFDHIYVSTEDEEIINISMKYGAEIIHRPENLSEDYTPTIPVIKHAIEWMSGNNLFPYAVCCIYATAPFLKVEDLIRGYEIFKKNKWNFVFSATKFSYPIQRAFKKLGYNVDSSHTLPKENGSQTGINFPFHTHQQPLDVRGQVITMEQFLHAFRFQNIPLIKAATNMKEGEGGRPVALCMIAALLERKNGMKYLDEVIRNFGLDEKGKNEFTDTDYIKRIKEKVQSKKY